MLRLPPALRGLVARCVFRNCGRTDVQLPLALVSKYRGHCCRHHDGLSIFKARRYATATPEHYENIQAQHEKEEPPPAPNASEMPKTTGPQETVDAILADLEAGRCQIEDEVYNEIEKELLLRFLGNTARRSPTYSQRRRLYAKTRLASATKDPMEALRRLVVVQLGVPNLLLTKASARLSNDTNVSLREQWMQELPEAVDLLNSKSLGDSQKADAKELLDALWAAKLAITKPKRMSQFETTMREALASPLPLDALRRVAVVYCNLLPDALRRRNAALLAGSRSNILPSESAATKSVQTQRDSASADMVGIAPEIANGIDLRTTSAELTSPAQSLTRQSGHGAKETADLGVQLDSKDDSAQFWDTVLSEVAENQNSTRPSVNSIEQDMLLGFLRKVDDHKDISDRPRFRQDIVTAIRGKKTTRRALRDLVDGEKQTLPSAAETIVHCNIKARFTKALMALEIRMQSQVESADSLLEAKELLKLLLARVENFGGLQYGGMHDPEPLVRIVLRAYKSPEPLNVLRLLALEWEKVPRELRLSISESLRASRMNSALYSKIKEDLAQMYKCSPSDASQSVANLDLFDAYYVLTKLPMPAKENLPHVFANLWLPKRLFPVLHSRCRALHTPIEIEEHWDTMHIPEKNLAKNSPQSYHVLDLRVKIPGWCEEALRGEGLKRSDAKDAAWLHLLSKLHKSGALLKLFPPVQSARNNTSALETEDRKMQPQHDAMPSKDAQVLHTRAAESEDEPRRLSSHAALPPKPMLLFDLKHIQSTCALPSQEQYSKALPELWEPRHVAAAIHDGCSQAKLSMESEVTYTEHALTAEQRKQLPGDPHRSNHYGCTLQVSIKNLSLETGYGEGTSKGEARRAAWLHVLSKLHMNGALAEIFPGSNAAPNLPEPVSADSSEPTVAVKQSIRQDMHAEEDVFELAEVDSRTLEQEKDAKTEIYNYAAAFGCVPHFETTVIQPRTPRARLGRIPKKPAPVVQVAIKVEDLSIDVTVTGANLQTAEVAAALAFKKKAEERHLQETDVDPDQGSRALNTDTAKQYLDFAKEHGIRMSLEMESETVKVGGLTHHQASLTADGEKLGQTVTMRARKDAQAAAYLAGALEIAKQHPHLTEGFQKALKKGNGKILRDISSISLGLEAEASQTMRNALVEAHAAGLPTSQEALLAEQPDIESNISRQPPPLDTLRTTRARDCLFYDQRAFDTDPALQELRKKKASLPMSQYKTEVLDMVNQNGYSIVVGATGSGKTTQVPQILFEDAIRQHEGPSTNIICTQPRRIAATSVARRVAEERNEPLRKTVGYQVRFDAQRPYNPHGITYCTTGILLEKLKHDPHGVLQATSHILIDEVHERDLNIDFLMIVLKRALHARKAQGRSVPKVVLMSATLDTELFANYFKQPGQDGNLQPAPCLGVPGRTFPVMEKYLGSIMHELLEAHGPEVKQLIEGDPKSQDFLNVETGFSSSMNGQTKSREPVIDWKRERTSVVDADGEPSAKDEKDEALVPCGLLAATIAHICATTPNDGAVLAFLPGLEEITNTQNILLGHQPFGMNFANSSKFKICLLHSSMPKEQQQEVFEPSPPGCRKVILSTNIAETSVTVTDVKYVVDTGKLRESRYDQFRRITKLQCVWESKSNSKQRMGRAGRVQDGFYYALFSKERADSLRAIGLPELLRSDLQETCLSITAQRFDEPVASFLAQAIEPPSANAVQAAIRNLMAIEAYTADEQLTALGRVLSSLPVHPTLGKMIVLGVIFRCLDPMIALGAAAEERSLFVVPLANREAAMRAHSSYTGSAQSDHLAHIAAFSELRQLNFDRGMDAVRSCARDQFLHAGAFRTIHQTAQQIVQILANSGLISEDAVPEGPTYGPPELNTNANNNDLIKCLFLAGSHPNLAVKLSEKGPMYQSPGETNILMHPGSVNKERRSGKEDNLIHPKGTLFTYSTLSRSNDGTNLFLRSATKVSPLMAVLFGGQLRISESGKLEMDGWVPFVVKGEQKEFSTKLILEFRKALERVLHRAYASLADLGETGEDGQVIGFADDLVREKFAQRVVEVLSGGPGDKSMDGWRSGWGMP